MGKEEIISYLSQLQAVVSVVDLDVERGHEVDGEEQVLLSVLQDEVQADADLGQAYRRHAMFALSGSETIR